MQVLYFCDTILLTLEFHIFALQPTKIKRSSHSDKAIKDNFCQLYNPVRKDFYSGFLDGRAVRIWHFMALTFEILLNIYGK